MQVWKKRRTVAIRIQHYDSAQSLILLQKPYNCVGRFPDTLAKDVHPIGNLRSCVVADEVLGLSTLR